MRGRSAPRAERFRTKMLSATKVGGGCNLGRSVEERKGGREGGREVSLGRRARVARTNGAKKRPTDYLLDTRQPGD